MKEEISISVCVPAFNEEKNIEKTVMGLFDALLKHLYRFEIIIVDDGSIDLTGSLAESLSRRHSQIKLLKHSINLGIGRCYRDAMRIAEGNFFTWFPSDGEDTAEEMLMCLGRAKEGAIVTSYHAEHGGRSAFRRLLSGFYTLILNSLFGQRLKYYNGLSVVSTQRVRGMILVSDGFFCNAEIIIRAIKSGCKVIEVETKLAKRLSGRSKALTCGSLKRAGIDFIRILRAGKTVSSLMFGGSI
ncbi:MAG: glycosyltransferase family 2 protein [Candidatus Omnitrophica bacterium]|nr:glycosyltransferase family 2 protein [Candidatus Omnitrophota bacterium]